MGAGLMKCRNCGNDTNVEIYEKKMIDGVIMTLIYCDRCPKAAPAGAGFPTILMPDNKATAAKFESMAVPAGSRGPEPMKTKDSEMARRRDAVDIPGRRVVFVGGADYDPEQRRKVLQRKYGIGDNYEIVSDNGWRVVADPRK